MPFCNLQNICIYLCAYIYICVWFFWGFFFFAIRFHKSVMFDSLDSSDIFMQFFLSSTYRQYIYMQVIQLVFVYNQLYGICFRGF